MKTPRALLPPAWDGPPARYFPGPLAQMGSVRAKPGILTSGAETPSLFLERAVCGSEDGTCWGHLPTNREVSPEVTPWKQRQEAN